MPLDPNKIVKSRVQSAFTSPSDLLRSLLSRTSGWPATLTTRTFPGPAPADQQSYHTRLIYRGITLRNVAIPLLNTDGRRGGSQGGAGVRAEWVGGGRGAGIGGGVPAAAYKATLLVSNCRRGQGSQEQGA